jgi:hypothetical protein
MYLDELWARDQHGEWIRMHGEGTYLLVREVEELVELDAAVRERAERALLLELGGECRVRDLRVLRVLSSAHRPAASRLGAP